MTGVQTCALPIEREIADHFILVRQKFVDSLLAIDESLYTDFLDEVDLLQGNLTKNIFDEGFNLNHKPKFEELITNEITKSKTKLIKILFTYTG